MIIRLYKVVELMAIRGFSLSHQTAHNWAQIFGIELGLTLKKAGKRDRKWHVDATYLKVEGRWWY